ncbi:MAG: ankyrin repeat domain-containing protein [Chloroflexota bacterium]
MVDQTLNQEQVREFVIAGHGNLDRVQELLAANPDLLNAAVEWRPGDTETAIQGASHTGNRPDCRILAGLRARRWQSTRSHARPSLEVEAILSADPEAIHTHGAHGISLLAHAVFSGDIPLVKVLVEQGRRTVLRWRWAMRWVVVMSQ